MTTTERKARRTGATYPGLYRAIGALYAAIGTLTALVLLPSGEHDTLVAVVVASCAVEAVHFMFAPISNGAHLRMRNDRPAVKRFLGAQAALTVALVAAAVAFEFWLLIAAAIGLIDVFRARGIKPMSDSELR